MPSHRLRATPSGATSTSFTVKSPFRGRFAQRIERDGELIVEATVDVACLNPEQRLIELPPALRALADS